MSEICQKPTEAVQGGTKDHLEWQFIQLSE